MRNLCSSHKPQNPLSLSLSKARIRALSSSLSLSRTYSHTKLKMEDDDEFGDLYTDVLRPFTTPAGSQPQEDMTAAIPASAAAATKTTTTEVPFQDSGQIDLNNIDSDDDEILGGASKSNSNSNVNRNDNNSGNSFMQRETLAFQPGLEKRPGWKDTDSDRVPNTEVERSIDGLAGGGEKGRESDIGARAFDNIEDAIAKERGFGGSNFMDEADINVVVEEGDDKDDDLVEKDENLVGKNENPGNLVRANENFENLGGEEGEPMIPGVSSIPGVYGGVGDMGDANFYEEDDSDSEDDLQIVLNNDDELGLMGMERMVGIGGEEDDDEDGDPLVIVSDNDNMGHQPIMEGQEWGEEKGAGMEGERRELGDAGKVNGGVAVPPKVPYGNHAYHHPFHSQFKYVRSGAAPMPGAAAAGPGGALGQVRPPVNVGPVAGRGRGEWRPAAVKGGPLMQKGFHPGYGMPVWGSNASGRGLEFTLPSHKTIFEVDIDSFEEKPWKLPGIDISDFFNFGLNEESWKDYCKQLEQQRLEATMQSRIRVYESGRTEQEYDPDLPPELAAASGLQDVPAENANLVKIDAGQNDSYRGSARIRPPLPTGRPIQVETNYTDRQPSIETRQSRIRDSDAIIEIVCHDSADEGSPENDMVEQQGDAISREDLRGADEIDELSQENAEQFDDPSHAHTIRKKEFVGRRGQSIDPSDKMSDGDEAFPFPSESSMRCHPSTREQTPIYSGSNSGVAIEERRIKGRTRGRSPRKATSGSPRDKQLVEPQNEGLYESIDGKNSLPSSSAIAVDAAGEDNVENKVTIPDESVQADKSSNRERDSIHLDITTQDDVLKDDKTIYSPGNQKSSSQVDQPSQDIDDGEDSKAARSSENSKARSASSKDYKKSHDGVEEEVVQGGRAACMGNTKRSIGRDETLRRKGYDGRQETERPHTSVKGMEESYSRKGWEPNSTNSLRVKTDSTDRRREVDYNERALQRSDEDLHGRRARVEDAKKRAHADEIGSRHRSKVREIERSEKDERHQLRDHLDNGSRRGNYDKDVVPKYRERDDSLKRRYENMDYLHNKRRKEDTFWRREQAEKEEILHGHRESSSSRKKERDDVSDQWKGYEPGRLRDEDIYIARHKEDAMFQRERGERQRDHDEWHRSKHSREEIISKRHREEGRSGLKSLRAAEEKMWSSHSRGKEEYKGYDREYDLKDAGRQSEQPKRRDRLETEILTQQKGREDGYVRGSQHSNDERRARHERASTRDDRAADDADNHKVHEKKHKEYPSKGTEPEAGDHNSLALSRRHQDEHSGQTSEMASSKGKIEQSSENEVHKNHQLSKKHNEEASSDDEHLLSRRGRSKLERWTSHKERDFSMSTSKSSSSLQIKEVETHNSIGPSLGSKLYGEPSKPVDDKQPPPSKDKDVPEINNVDVKLVNKKHLDTVEKLKKRSERFKLPLPSEKEAMATKKVENEPRASGQNEIQPDTEIKPERPARKRRWTSNS